MAASLQLYAARPEPAAVVDLTGGLDTRLVLALILLEGLADTFTFETVGPPELADVRIATQIAHDLGLRYESTFEVRAERGEFVDMVKAFVSGTGGLCNIFEARPFRPRGPRTRVSGANGECLRAQQVVHKTITSKDDLLQVVGKGYGQLGLLRPDVDAAFRRTTRDEVLNDPIGGLPPLDLLDSYHFRLTARKRYGPLDELQEQQRLLPLYSIHAIRAAFALGGEARQSALIHFEIVRHASESLARQPITGKGWPSRLLDALPNGDDYRPAPGTDDLRKGPPLFAHLQRTISEDRFSVLRDVLADSDNVAWELLERDKAVRSLAHYGDLNNGQRKELFGAVTAALWLGDYVDP
jgi:hypothetical protein